MWRAWKSVPPCATVIACFDHGVERGLHLVYRSRLELLKRQSKLIGSRAYDLGIEPRHLLIGICEKTAPAQEQRERGGQLRFTSLFRPRLGPMRWSAKIPERSIHRADQGTPTGARHDFQ